MVYQEQVMQTAVVMAGFSMGEADTLRKAMGKKIRGGRVPSKEQLRRGRRREGRDRGLAGGLFD